ncbi:MAG: arsenic resistance N-acetyltransferase ArsN2 [Woeseiaceae bacterium]
MFQDRVGTVGGGVVADLHMPTLRRATATDRSAIVALLSAEKLPVADLDAEKISGFLVAEDGTDLLGLIGVELYGTVGLLRSLVITRNARRLGLGSKLVGALESAADAAGVTELWLLTIDAQQYFDRLGYHLVGRDDAPESIRESGEFSRLCPESAHLMMKRLY